MAGHGSTLPLAWLEQGVEQAGRSRVEQDGVERARLEQAFRPANSDTTHEGFSLRGTYPGDSPRFGEVFHGKQLAMTLHDADTHHIHIGI